MGSQNESNSPIRLWIAKLAGKIGDRIAGVVAAAVVAAVTAAALLLWQVSDDLLTISVTLPAWVIVILLIVPPLLVFVVTKRMDKRGSAKSEPSIFSPVDIVMNGRLLTKQTRG